MGAHIAAKYVISVLFGALGLYFAVMNDCIVISWLTKKRNSSLVPPVGGILLCIATAVLPANPYNWLCIVAFCLDFGGIVWIISFIDTFLIHADRLKKHDTGAIGEFTAVETTWIEALLDFSSPVRDDLLKQLSSASVQREYNRCFISLRLTVDKSTSAPIRLKKRVPVELYCEPKEGMPVAVLLHIADGYVNEIELYRIDSSDMGDVTTFLDGKVELKICDEIMPTDYSQLKDCLSIEELEYCFSEFLDKYTGFCDTAFALDELFELADRQWHTYKLLNSELRERIDDYVIGVIDYDNMDVMESIMTIIPRLGLVKAYNTVVCHKDKITDKRILQLVQDCIREYGDNVDNPYSGMH